MSAFPQKPRQSLADLRPAAQIDCMYGDHKAPAVGAVRFHRLVVCAACAAKIKSKQEEKS